MRALVVYESMFGNTHVIAERIAEGLREAGEARVLPVGRADAAALAGVDLVVVGGPTHVHGVSTERSREAARGQAAAPDSGVDLDADAEGPGLRDWFDGVTLPAGVRGAAFDTRVHGPAILTGRASRGIAQRLTRAGARVEAPPESFMVSRENHLDEGEEDRARGWGRVLAGLGAAAPKP